jgi:hypothetical protein
MLPRLASNLRFSNLILPSAGITGVNHYALSKLFQKSSKYIQVVTWMAEFCFFSFSVVQSDRNLVETILWILIFCQGSAKWDSIL